MKNIGKEKCGFWPFWVAVARLTWGHQVELGQVGWFVFCGGELAQNEEKCLAGDVTWCTAAG